MRQPRVLSFHHRDACKFRAGREVIQNPLHPGRVIAIIAGWKLARHDPDDDIRVLFQYPLRIESVRFFEQVPCDVDAASDGALLISCGILAKRLISPEFEKSIMRLPKPHPSSPSTLRCPPRSPHRSTRPAYLRSHRPSAPRSSPPSQDTHL